MSEKWEFTNHGGTPTSNESKKYAIFVGRFQPYHQGHISLIMQKIIDWVSKRLDLNHLREVLELVDWMI